MTPATLALCLLLTQTPSPGAEAITRAEQAMEQLEVDEAAKAWSEALQQPATREERLRTWRGLGLALAFMGRTSAARTAFETLLTLDPSATVPSNLGPKITRPFEAARRAVARRKPSLTLERDRYTGALRTTVEAAGLPLATLRIFASEAGAEAERGSMGAAEERVLEFETDPTREVRAHAQALDENGGVLLERGTRSHPLTFPAVAEAASPAVAAAQELATEEELEAPPSRWPWIAGAVAIVGAGVVTGVLLSQGAGPQLSLPQADRAGQLP